MAEVLEDPVKDAESDQQEEGRGHGIPRPAPATGEQGAQGGIEGDEGEYEEQGQ